MQGERLFREVAITETIIRMAQTYPLSPTTYHLPSAALYFPTTLAIFGSPWRVCTWFGGIV